MRRSARLPPRTGCEPMTVTTSQDLAALEDALLPLVQRAGAAILRHYAGEIETAYKADRSPVTAADQEAEEILVEGLRRLTPEIPVVAEEAVAAGRIPEVGDAPFWLVDPLDGTREFLSRNGEFTVNLGLVRGRRPVFGIVMAPARGCIWVGIADRGAFRREKGERVAIRVRAADPAQLVAVASRSHRDPETDAWLRAHAVARTISAGSSLKFCAVAEGRADVYPRFGPTMEWDTAAGHAVLAAAGGRVVTVTGEPLAYAKPGFRNPGFIAYGGLEPFPPEGA